MGVRMKDLLTFSGELRDGHLVAVVAGFDAHSHPVEFVVDPAQLLINQWTFVQFLTELAAVARVFVSLVASGFSLANAWALVEPMIPRPVVLATSFDQAS
jgi:hypothetical protein